jgi:hypothetical protein
MSLSKFKKSKKSEDVRSKFKKKDKKILKETYDEREKRSSMFGDRKGIFNHQILEELGIREFKINPKKDGTYFFEYLPCSFDSDDKAFMECSTHFNVGMNNDSFICIQRLLNKPCYRCKVQKKLYNVHKTTTDEIKALFPSDRVIHLLWDRTDELANDKPQTHEICVWSAPKKGVHSEIQSKTRNKLTKEIIDISDISEDGEGKTVYFEIAVKKTEDGEQIPTYEGFDLVDREEPIPEEIVSMLSDIIEELQSRMTKDMVSPLQVLLNIPTYEEVEEAMVDDVYDEHDDKKESKKESKKEKLKRMKQEAEDEEKESDGVDLESLEEELKSMSKFAILKYMKEEGLKKYADSDLSKEMLIDKILSIYSEQDDF